MFQGMWKVSMGEYWLIFKYALSDPNIYKVSQILMTSGLPIFAELDK